jgi:hypothetical protein
MGLFGSRKVTTVGTQVQRVIEDDKLPDSILNGFYKNQMKVMKGEPDQSTEYVLEELSSSIALRANRMYNFGKRDYVHGVPISTYKSSFAGKDAAKAAIEAQVGSTVQLAYYHFGPINLMHLGWKTLVESHGYDAQTNKLNVLSVSKGKDVFLSDMQVVVVEATLDEYANGSLDQWGTPPNAGVTPELKYQIIDVGSLKKPTPFMVDPAAAEDYIKVTYCWEEDVIVQIPAGISLDGTPVVTNVPKKELHKESFIIPISGYEMEADFHQAKYTTGTGVTGYWLYQANEGSQPAIDNVFNTEYSNGGSFFPWTYFRYEKKSEVDYKDTIEYKDSKKLLKYLNMNFDDIGEGINENPDIKDVEQAMMVMAVPANTSNPLEQRYLFNFFKEIDVDPTAPKQTLRIGSLLNFPLPGNAIIIQDKRFKMSLYFDAIIKRRVPGNIGAKGSYASGFGTVTETKDVESTTGDTKTWSSSRKQHWYRHQVTDTVYEEVLVDGLKMTYFVFGNYTTTGDEEDEILLIPIDMDIAKTYSISDREELYSRSLHYVFNSRIVTKLKWYQTGFFKTLLIVVAIVITVMSMGTTWESIVAAVSIGLSVNTIVMLVIADILIQMLIAYAVKLFVKVVGIKFAFLAAVVAAIYGGFSGFQAGSLSNAPFASELLQLSTGLMKAISAQVQDDFNDLLGQQTELEKEIDKKTKLLETAQDLLNNNNRFDPLIVWGETPNQFYERTVHSGNIGVLGIDAVSSYVDTALQLPKIYQSLS